MKKISMLFTILVLLASYSFAEEQMEFSGEEAKKEIAKYLSSPSDTLLITIESIPKQITYNKVTIHKAAEENNSTFEVYTPYCMKVPMDMLEDMKKEYHKIKPTNPKEREAYLDELRMVIETRIPNIIIIAQSQSTIGIQGTAYYKGKSFVSSVAEVPYGAVNLNVKIPAEEYILESSKP